MALDIGKIRNVAFVGHGGLHGMEAWRAAPDALLRGCLMCRP